MRFLSYHRTAQEDILNAARKRDCPSVGLRSAFATQKETEPDAMYKGRPHELTAPPIEIYHSVFAIAQPTESFKFSAAELRPVHTFVTNSLAFYDDEAARRI